MLGLLSNYVHKQPNPKCVFFLVILILITLMMEVLTCLTDLCFKPVTFVTTDNTLGWFSSEVWWRTLYHYKSQTHAFVYMCRKKTHVLIFINISCIKYSMNQTDTCHNFSYIQNIFPYLAERLSNHSQHHLSLTRNIFNKNVVLPTTHYSLYRLHSMLSLSHTKMQPFIHTQLQTDTHFMILG